jgi:fatty-acyl-CoA synthase
MRSSLYTDWVSVHGDQRSGFIAIDAADGQLTYAELVTAMRQVAGGLRSLGLGHGDRVAIALEPSGAYVTTILGVLVAGAVVVPINTRLSPTEVSAYLDDIEPELLVCDPRHRTLLIDRAENLVMLPDLREDRTIIERLDGLVGERFVADLSQDDIATIFPTGGTTGLPKGAVLDHRALWLWVNGAVIDEGRVAHEREIFCSPFFHVSVITGVLTTLYGAGTVLVHLGFDAGAVLAAIERGGTRLMATPTLLRALSDHPDFDVVDRTRLRSILFGSTGSTRSFLQDVFEQWPSTHISHGFGSTECGPTSRAWERELRDTLRAGVGHPELGARVSILDADGRPSAPGEVGSIAVETPWQTMGYWRRPRDTERTFTDRGVVLGDLGTQDEHGWLTIVGRSTDMIISGGENIYPAEVENVLQAHPDIREVVVVGIPDEYWGERLEAALVLEPNSSVDIAALRAFAEPNIGAYKIPKAIHAVPTIPLTAASKIDRGAVRQMIQAVTGRGA